jgi:hypothetical protein
LVGGDPANPIQHLHARVSLDHLSNEALEALDKFTQSLTEEKQR